MTTRLLCQRCDRNVLCVNRIYSDKVGMNEGSAFDIQLCHARSACIYVHSQYSTHADDSANSYTDNPKRKLINVD